MTYRFLELSLPDENLTNVKQILKKQELGVTHYSLLLVATLTFSIQKLHPFTWWEGKQAKKLIFQALLLWTSLLILLYLLFFFNLVI